MAYCSSCGNELTEAARFCSHCAAPKRPTGTRTAPHQPARRPRSLNRQGPAASSDSTGETSKGNGSVAQRIRRRKKLLLFGGLPILLIIVWYGIVLPATDVESELSKVTDKLEESIATREAKQLARIDKRHTDIADSTLTPVVKSPEVPLSRDSCAFFLMAATTIEPRGVEVMKQVADKYAPGMAMELVGWLSERGDTLPTGNLHIVNFAKMLALVREGAIPGIKAGDYYTLRSRYNELGRWPHSITDADTLAMEIIGNESSLDELFGKIDVTNPQIQIDRQKEQSIASCANLDELAPVSVTVALPLAGFASGRCDGAIAFYLERMEILTKTFPGVDGDRRASVTLSFRDPQPDTFRPRLLATLQKAGESIAERCRTTPTVSLTRTVEIDIDGDSLKFDKAKLSARAGSTVTLVFLNDSATNQHNWVLVQPGTKDEVAAAGTAAGPGLAWIPQDDDRVLAQTGLLDPGATEEVTFTAPTPGTYQFVCTFPGHNFTMFGDFEVFR